MRWRDSALQRSQVRLEEKGAKQEGGDALAEIEGRFLSLCEAHPMVRTSLPRSDACGRA